MTSLLTPLCAQSVQHAFAGAQACAKCHASVHREWVESLHHRMMQPASSATVRGNFAQGRTMLGGVPNVLRSSNGSFYITESELTGKPVEHRVEYTLGDRRLQHYLTTLSDGRIVILSPTWDIVRKKWTSDAELHNPEEARGAPFQVWNKSCYGCHASGEQKNFDPGQLSYRTAWRQLGVDCESCHGPAGAHIAKNRGAIVNPAKLDAAPSTMVCAPCHSLRDTYAAGFQAGDNYYDFYLPMLEYRLSASGDPAYWADGRPGWLANSAVGLWESQCFLKGGATCVTCHARHAPAVEQVDYNAICAKCHQAVAAKISAHTHHAAGSSGSSCIGCHMPESVVGAGVAIRDHSMSIPVPENTVRHAIPNACNLCHRDRDALWASRQMDSWYGGASRRKFIVRADAFTDARQGSVTAVPALLEILRDATAGPWIRANAAGYLGSFPNEPTAYDAVLRAFSDSDPLVRATAASALRPRAGQKPAAASALVPLLGDAALTVRVSAAVALVAMGVQPFPGPDGERFERAKDLYRARAALFSDDATQQYAAGQFFYLAGDADASVAAFRTALKLQPKIPARYFLARSLAKKGDFPGARDVLKEIAADDPQYGAAQQLLASVEPKIGAADSDAEVKFRSAQTLFQSEYYGAALQDLEDALRRAPQAEWASKAQVYRAICLEKLSRTREAEAALRVLAAVPGALEDLDLQFALVEVLSETGRAEEALRRIDDVIGAVPKAAMAYFWRARLLLQLHRTAEAATAAEEAVRLTPDLAPAHNLLIRIYQLLGRTREAAQQAEWLRDYERRIKSR